MMEFHISRLAREKYQFDSSLFSYNGNVIFANFHAARVFSQKMNQKRDLISYPEQVVHSSQINAMGLIDEIFHHVFALYRKQKNPFINKEALKYLQSHLGHAETDQLLMAFVSLFPPLEVYQSKLSPETYLNSGTKTVNNRTAVLEEMLLLWVANQNPAHSQFMELFDDHNLAETTQYDRAMQVLHSFFEKQPKFGPDQQNLLDMFLAPAIAVPNSLTGQLEFIRQRWFDLLGAYLYRLLNSLDLLKEEEKQFFSGPGPMRIPIYGKELHELEPENFSPDSEWMPRLVMIAKNTYVWLDQLSKKYAKPIRHLDQVPDEELQILAEWGFTGLWLIGLWERSRASARIKQLCGNSDAIASAYSLYSYEIASDLGGETAYQSFRDRARHFGIRLASDMVPNHMAIDSPWVADNPDWFLSLHECPYPTHSFNGPNLSDRQGLGIFLEDHYFDRTDAAVEFKRVDFNSGDTRFIYHGNDGTSMPWNDTAQLNYLNPEVREAIIQTILNVARKFPIIRFDAAMTLTKKHFQRLWFPEPGSGGAIPTRAENGLSKDEFNALMPVEFWREVVDRVSHEVPDTLLLAEAFWLMEGYFVRTLGMHRVYNSAFMNMLRNEDNANYRKLIKNTLEFEPEILKRYVNFMNNPDEKTAAEQFGKGDKYFGICVVMSTLPGLPMFGHGQVEGFSEKYGMEFHKAYWDETVDDHLVSRHEKEIFPLLHRRSLFAGVENFQLYDFYSEGLVNENVYAFSNQEGDQHGLVIYHNHFGSTSGNIHLSSGVSHKKQNGSRQLLQKTLAQSLNLERTNNGFLFFRDLISNLEFIQPANSICEKGLYLELSAYQYHVFSDFRVQVDDEWGSYAHVCEILQGHGVPSIQTAISELILAPVQKPFKELVNPGFLSYLLEYRYKDKLSRLHPDVVNQTHEKLHSLLLGISELSGYDGDRAEIEKDILLKLDAILSLPYIQEKFPSPGSTKYIKALKETQQKLANDLQKWFILLGWLFTHNLGKMVSSVDQIEQSATWFDEWKLGQILLDSYRTLGYDSAESHRMVSLIRILINQQSWHQSLAVQSIRNIAENWLSQPEIQKYIGVNRWQEILWFNHESFTDFLWWMKLLPLLSASGSEGGNAALFVERVLVIDNILKKVLSAEKKSKYQIEELLLALKS